MFIMWWYPRPDSNRHGR